MRQVATLILVMLIAIQAFHSQESVADEHQKAVLITGASSGIGLMTAKHLASEGYFVYAGARKQSDLDALNKIENVMAVRLDVTVQEEIDKAVELVESEGRGLWGIVNNAGVNVIDPLIEADESDLQFLFDVNVYGVFRVTKAFAPMVIESKGRIVNISSIAGTLSGGLDGYGMYVMSKHALEAYTDQLTWEMRKFGVKVSSIAPGNFESQIGESRCKRMLRNQAKKTYAYYQEEMDYYLDSCRKLQEDGVTYDSPTPEPVAEAIEHALFNDKPKEHYLVVAVAGEAHITVGKAMEELVHLNHDQPYEFSREDLIRLLDSETAIIRGEKQRGRPGEM